MDRDHPQGNVHHKHRPEFIIIEDAHTEKAEGKRSEKAIPLGEIFKVDFPFSLRIMSLGFSFVLFLAAFIVLMGAVLCLLGYGVSFGYSEVVKNQMVKCYRWGRKFLVMGLGFGIAIFSPSLGLALIVIYFMLQGEKMNPSLSRIFQAEE